MVVFACDPKSGEKLSKVALEEIEQLINDGPTEEDCQTDERSRTKVHPRTQRRKLVLGQLR